MHVHGWRFNLYWNGAGGDGGDGGDGGTGAAGGNSGVGGSGGTSSTDSGGQGGGSPGAASPGPATGPGGTSTSVGTTGAPAGTGAPGGQGGSVGWGGGVGGTTAGDTSAPSGGGGESVGWGGQGGQGGVSTDVGGIGGPTSSAADGLGGSPQGTNPANVAGMIAASLMGVPPGVTQGWAYGTNPVTVTNLGPPSLSDVATQANLGVPSPSLSSLADALSLMGGLGVRGTPSNMGFPAVEGVSPGLTAAPAGPSQSTGLEGLAGLSIGPGGIGADTTVAPTSTYGDMSDVTGFGGTTVVGGSPAPGGVTVGGLGGNLGFGNTMGVGFNSVSNAVATNATAPATAADATVATMMNQSPSQQTQTMSQAIATAQATMTPAAYEAFLTTLLARYQTTYGEGQAQPSVGNQGPGEPNDDNSMNTPSVPGVINPRGYAVDAPAFAGGV